MTDPAGLQFIVSTPAQTLDKQDRKAIRSHATRAGVSRQQAVQLRSWISPERELGSLRNAESILSVPSPRHMGSDFSGLQLPPGFEPCMIQDLVKCMHNLRLISTHLSLKQNE